MTDEHDDHIHHDGHGRADPLIQPKREGLWGGLRSSFFAGVVVAAPIGITITIIYWFITGPMAKLDAFVKHSLPDGGSTLETFLQVLPGFGVLLAVVALIVLGAFAKNFIGRSLLHIGERLVDSVPVVRNLYRFFKNVFETALQQSDRSFKQVALIEYPRRGSWAMAFVVGDARGEIDVRLEGSSKQYTALFLPTVPNPTSGFLLFMPKDEVQILDMSVEDAAKVIFSLGLVVPEFKSPEEVLSKLAGESKKAEKESLRKKLFSKVKKSS